MSQTACERHPFLVPMRWRHAGRDLSRPNHASRRADRPLMRFTRRPRCPLRASSLPCAHPSRSPRASIAHIMAGAKNQIPIALAAQPPSNFPRLRALALFGRRPIKCEAPLVIAGVQKPAQNNSGYSHRCPIFGLQLAPVESNGRL